MSCRNNVSQTISFFFFQIFFQSFFFGFVNQQYLAKHGKMKFTPYQYNDWQFIYYCLYICMYVSRQKSFITLKSYEFQPQNLFHFKIKKNIPLLFFFLFFDVIQDDFLLKKIKIIWLFQHFSSHLFDGETKQNKKKPRIFQMKWKTE